MNDVPEHPAELVVPPPPVKIMNYPVSIGVISAVIAICILLVVSNKFDQTHGALTISLLIVLCFVGTVTFCLLYTIPQDQTTAAVVGGLVAAVGAVVAFWLKPRDPER